MVIFILSININGQNLDNLYANASNNASFMSHFTVNENTIITDHQLKKWVAKNPNLFENIDSISKSQYKKWFWGSTKTLISRVSFVKSENTEKRKFYFAEIARKKEEARLAEIARIKEEARLEALIPIKKVKNVYWKNNDVINLNLLLKNYWEKAKDFKTTDFYGNTIDRTTHRFSGWINKENGLPEGNGTFVIGYSGSNEITGNNVLAFYEGKWLNGKFNGEGKFVDKYYSDYYVYYTGSWKDGDFNGKGILTETFEQGKIEFLVYNGNFLNGKKNGLFKVYGQFRDQVNRKIWIQGLTQSLYKKFGYEADAEYKNDEVVKYKIIEDQEGKFNTYFEQIYKAREETAQKVKLDNCLNCEINYSKSTYPREEDNFLWVGTSHRTGEIVMKNGDKYSFDYKDGKCKVINGWFETDDYYPSFIKMVETLKKKCVEKYCN